jgi:hypothetical protein
MLPASMLKAPVCPTPIGCFTDNVEERFFILLIPPAITPVEGMNAKSSLLMPHTGLAFSR